MASGYTHPDIKYIKQFEIGSVICQALSDAYLAKPSDPINYIAHWLISYSNSKDVTKDVHLNRLIYITKEKDVL